MKPTLTNFLVAVVLFAGGEFLQGEDEKKAPVPTASSPSELSLEELMNIKVTSAAKKPEKLSDAAAAIFVITGEEIRRSGATSLPEALRLAPGVAVARLDAHSYAITARGFNSEFANKLLVLIDGRTIYTPLFAGVFWDAQDVLMEDIDRIEVLRGPGGALWGANAVNGVINIVTKSAKETQGFLVSGGGGTQENGFGSVRFGEKVGEGVYFRLYAKSFLRDDLPGAQARDWQLTQGGFRMDWFPDPSHHSFASPVNQLTFQGDFYDGQSGTAFLAPVRTIDKDVFRGGNLLARWTHTGSEGSEVMVQTYYDRVERRTDFFDYIQNTVDAEFQHRLRIFKRQEIIWGLGYRLLVDDTDRSEFFGFNPAGRTLQQFSGFFHDEIELIEDRLTLSGGAKLEHNQFTGWEVQPDLRLAWKPTVRQTVWAAVSRAVRTPSRTDHDLDLTNSSSPILVKTFGNSSLRAEELLAFEAGYRAQLHTSVTVDMSAFYNVYDHLRSNETGVVDPTTVPPTLPIVFGDNLSGETLGVEVAAQWQVQDWWRLSGSYAFLQMEIHRENGSADTSTERTTEHRDPRHQFQLRSAMKFPGHWEFDCWLRYVDRLPALPVDRYVSLDLRLAWQPTRHWELSVVGQNLLDGRHPEFVTAPANPMSEVERSVYGKVTWRY